MLPETAEYLRNYGKKQDSDHVRTKDGQIRSVYQRHAGTKEGAYSLFPLPKTPLTQAEMDEFKAKKVIEEAVSRFMENQGVK